jgi:glycerol-3-phosphate O-acyltransferase / dihydroxyacetone phosphate acyltransferase
MTYRLLRAVVRFALHLFYRIKVHGPANVSGAVIYVGNHPNGLVDPALILASVSRQLTFLAKAPLFSMPVLGLVMRSFGALPVYRKHESPGQMGSNDATLDAAANALVGQRAIMLFPEGKSHSEPALAEMKTGAARIAQRVVKQGAAVQFVPVGLTYEDKNLFRSPVRVEFGQAISVSNVPPSATQEQEVEWVRELTKRIEAGLREVTLNLGEWEELPLLETAEALYAFRRGDAHAAGNPERLRTFAKGVALLRRENPDQLLALKSELAAFKRRLDLLNADASDLHVRYRPRTVLKYIARNLLALVFGFPLFALGMVVFAPPYFVVRAIYAALKPELDVEATVKLLTTMVIAPLWWALLVVFAGAWFGPIGALLALVGALPLALFTRYFFERRQIALRDAGVFFRLANRGSLKASLSEQGDRIAQKIETLAVELQPRL